MSSEGQSRPRVLILGGGFAGIGAARELKKADVDVVVVDKHDYHTFQPLLYQVATGAPRAVRGRASATRPLPRAGERQGPRGHRHGHRPGQAGGAVRGDGATRLRLPRARTRRRGQLLRRRWRPRARVPDVHARRCGSPQRSTSSPSSRRRTRTSRSPRTALCTSSSSVAARPEWRARARSRSFTGRLRRGLPGPVDGACANHARRGLPAPVRHVQGEPPRVHAEDARGARCRGLAGRDRRVGRAHARYAEVRNGPRRPHAHLGGRAAGESAGERARPRARTREPGRRRAGSQHRRPSGGVRSRRHRLDHRHEDRRGAPPARLRGAAGRGARRREHCSSRQRQGSRSRSGTTTRARWPRSAAALPSSSCRAGGR